MSIMRSAFFYFSIILLLHRCSTFNDSDFQIQPQSVLINDLNEKYITSDKHYIGQDLYRYDQLKLSCDCQTESNQIKYHIYWTVNNKTLDQFNNSNNLQLIIDVDTVQTPITYVTCYCRFLLSNSAEIIRYYQYQLYIDLESEPSLKPIEYVVQSSVFKGHFHHFMQQHFLAIPIFIAMIITVICLLVILSFIRS